MDNTSSTLLFSQLNDSSVDLVVAGTKDAVMMVEAGSAEVSEEVILGAIRHGQDAKPRHYRHAGGDGYCPWAT